MVNLKILLVDDDYILARGTAKLIERLGGYKVHITDEPGEIFRQCQSGEIDLVMMDVNLPGATWDEQEVSGVDLCLLLKTQSDTAHIPIILLTAYAMYNEKKDVLATSRADEFCSKPITDYPKLIQLITDVVEKSKSQL